MNGPSGNVRLERGGMDYDLLRVTDEGVAITEHDLCTSWGGKVWDYTPAKSFSPAPPGWWARWLWLDEKADEMHIEYLPVVGWLTDHEGYGEAVMIGWEGLEPTNGDLSSSNALVDQVFYDPTRPHDIPPPSELTLRAKVEDANRRRAKRRAEQNGAAS